MGYLEGKSVKEKLTEAKKKRDNMDLVALLFSLFELHAVFIFLRVKVNEIENNPYLKVNQEQNSLSNFFFRMCSNRKKSEIGTCLKSSPSK